MDLDAALRAFLENRPRGPRLLADALRTEIVKCLHGRVEPSNIEDVTQETLARVFKRLDEYEDRGPGSLRVWVRGIARNTARETYREQARQFKIVDAASLVWPFFTSSLEQLHWREWLAVLRQGLDELEPIYASAVIHIAEGRAAAELALIEEVSPQAILTRAKRGRDQLRVYIRDQRRISGRFLSTITEKILKSIIPGDQ